MRNALHQAKDRLAERSRNVVDQYKDPINRFGRNAQVDRERFENADEDTIQQRPQQSQSQYAEPERRTSTHSNLYSYEPNSLNLYQNKLLTAMDQCVCCRCAKRWQLALLANIGFIIVFGIRCNFGAARSEMLRNYTDPQGEFHWTADQLGIMEGSFFYGYLITQLPGGFLASKFAPNKLFGLAIGAASFLNLLMPFAARSGVSYVVMLQASQGFVQGVSYPAMHGIWRFWAPPMERSKLATTAFTGSYAGAVIGLPFSAYLVYHFGWASPFYLYGVAGVLWAVFWFAMTFEKPSTHPTISAEERSMIEASLGQTSLVMPSIGNIPWRAILTSKPVWAIIVANFARSWTFYLLLNHQLAFMSEGLHMKITESGFYAALPHAVMALMVLVGGQLADYLRSNQILSTTAVRKIMNCGGFGGEAFFLLFVGYSSSPTFAITALVIAVGMSGFAISGFNVNHLDLAPRYASLLMGMSNGMGTFSGMICPVVTENLKTHGRKGWQTVFLLASLIHFTGVVFYGFFASGEQQPWAEPPAELEPALQPDNFAMFAQHKAGYGTTADVKIDPLDEQLLRQHGGQYNGTANYGTNYQQNYEPTSVQNESYR